MKTTEEKQKAAEERQKALEEKQAAKQKAAEEKQAAKQKASEERQKALEEKQAAKQKAAEEKQAAKQKAAEEKQAAKQKAAEEKQKTAEDRQKTLENKQTTSQAQQVNNTAFTSPEPVSRKANSPASKPFQMRNNIASHTGVYNAAGEKITTRLDPRFDRPEAGRFGLDQTTDKVDNNNDDYYNRIRTRFVEGLNGKSADETLALSRQADIMNNSQYRKGATGTIINQRGSTHSINDKDSERYQMKGDTEEARLQRANTQYQQGLSQGMDQAHNAANQATIGQHLANEGRLFGDDVTQYWADTNAAYFNNNMARDPTAMAISANLRNVMLPTTTDMYMKQLFGDKGMVDATRRAGYLSGVMGAASAQGSLGGGFMGWFNPWSNGGTGSDARIKDPSIGKWISKAMRKK